MPTKAAPEKLQRTIYLLPELDKDLRVYAAAARRRVSDVVADAITAYLKSRKR